MKLSSGSLVTEHDVLEVSFLDGDEQGIIVRLPRDLVAAARPDVHRVDPDKREFHPGELRKDVRLGNRWWRYVCGGREELEAGVSDRVVDDSESAVLLDVPLGFETVDGPADRFAVLVDLPGDADDCIARIDRE
jgi:hypothetical protein